jgi:hypothetical protein
MKCVITGVETKLKWNNIPIDRDILDMAKQMHTDHENDPIPLTMRQCIAKIYEMWMADKAQAQAVNS